MQTNDQPTRVQTPATEVQAPATAEASIVVPMTRAEYEGLKARRSELSNQLINVSGRRKGLAEQLRGADGADKVGLEQRIAVLDQRIVQLESDIASTGRQLTSASAGALATGPRAFGILSSDQTLALSIVFTVLILFPLAIAAARIMFRKAKQPVTVPAIQGEAAKRLERLEQSVESIAVEVERISEGQRFVTRLLSATPQGGILPGGQKETVAVKLSD